MVQSNGFPAAETWHRAAQADPAGGGDDAVSNAAKILDRILRGTSDASIRFDDLRAVLTRLGFTERVRGGHHILTRDGVPEILNLQPRGSQAKPYQVKQVRGVIVAHGLAGEPEEERTGEAPPAGESSRATPEEGRENGSEPAV